MKLFWRIRLCFLVMYTGYGPSWRHPMDAWSFAGEDSFEDYRTSGCSPMEALREDASYADLDVSEGYSGPK